MPESQYRIATEKKSQFKAWLQFYLSYRKNPVHKFISRLLIFFEELWNPKTFLFFLSSDIDKQFLCRKPFECRKEKKWNTLAYTLARTHKNLFSFYELSFCSHFVKWIAFISFECEIFQSVKWYATPMRSDHIWILIA